MARARQVGTIALGTLAILAVTLAASQQPATCAEKGVQQKAAQEAEPPAQAPAVTKPKKPRGRLPAFYNRVVKRQQREKIYEIQREYQPKIDELTTLLKEEKTRYAKLFAITEELEGELSESRRQISLRDQWFRRNVAALEGIGKAIKDRTTLLEEAPELDVERKVSFETLPEPDKKVKFETMGE